MIKREDSMDVDYGQVDLPSPLAEAVPKQKMMIVPEEKLEGRIKPSILLNAFRVYTAAKSLFNSIRATHIYSVEPSKFMVGPPFRCILES
jgi:hypothetical protein